MLISFLKYACEHWIITIVVVLFIWGVVGAIGETIEERAREKEEAERLRYEEYEAERRREAKARRAQERSKKKLLELLNTMENMVAETEVTLHEISNALPEVESLTSEIEHIGGVSADLEQHGKPTSET